MPVITRSQARAQQLNVPVFKIILAGDGGVGKSTYLRRHLTGEFTRNYVATVGAEVHPIDFIISNGRKIVFNIWDTARQEKYSGVASTYYQKADAAIIMFDVTSKTSYKNVSKWYKDIRAFCPDIPIIIVGNKCESKDRKVMASGITFHRSRNLSYFDISAKSNYNFEKPFLRLARALLNDPTIQFTESSSRQCTHDCDLWNSLCCACSDMRPVANTYLAFNNSYISQASLVSRNFYYCPTCKE